MTLVIWLAVVLMLGGAVLLVAGVGASGLWIAVIAVGLALVAIEQGSRSSQPGVVIRRGLAGLLAVSADMPLCGGVG